MFHFLKWLIFNYFITKNETWKINQRFWKRMDICSINCNLSAQLGGVLTWGRRVPPIRQINCNLSNIYPYVFKTFDLSFMFHFLLQSNWISVISKSETYDFNVSFLVSCFTIQNTEGALSRSLSVFKSLPQCFWIAPTVFLFFSHSVFRMKHWNQKWNIKVACFSLQKNW